MKTLIAALFGLLVVSPLSAGQMMPAAAEAASLAETPYAGRPAAPQTPITAGQAPLNAAHPIVARILIPATLYPPVPEINVNARPGRAHTLLEEG